MWNAQMIEPKWQDPHVENVVKTQERKAKILRDASAGEKRI